jgi:hypothetical protein
MGDRATGAGFHQIFRLVRLSGLGATHQMICPWGFQGRVPGRTLTLHIIAKFYVDISKTRLTIFFLFSAVLIRG